MNLLQLASEGSDVGVGGCDFVFVGDLYPRVVQVVDDGDGGLVLVPHVFLLEFDEVLLVDGFGELVDADFGRCLLRVECVPEGRLLFVEAEEVRRRCGVFDVNVDVGGEFEAGVGLY